jgi:hypothetical protein
MPGGVWIRSNGSRRVLPSSKTVDAFAGLRFAFNTSYVLVLDTTIRAEAVCRVAAHRVCSSLRVHTGQSTSRGAFCTPTHPAALTTAHRLTLLLALASSLPL